MCAGITELYLIRLAYRLIWKNRSRLVIIIYIFRNGLALSYSSFLTALINSHVLSHLKNNCGFFCWYFVLLFFFVLYVCSNVWHVSSFVNKDNWSWNWTLQELWSHSLCVFFCLVCSILSMWRLLRRHHEFWIWIIFRSFKILKCIVLYVLLAPHTNEQWDLLHRIHEGRQLELIPEYNLLLELFINQELISWKVCFIFTSLCAFCMYANGNALWPFRSILSSMLVFSNRRIDFNQTWRDGFSAFVSSAVPFHPKTPPLRLVSFCGLTLRNMMHTKLLCSAAFNCNSRKVY